MQIIGQIIQSNKYFQPYFNINRYCITQQFISSYSPLIILIQYLHESQIPFISLNKTSYKIWDLLHTLIPSSILSSSFFSPLPNFQKQKSHSYYQYLRDSQMHKSKVLHRSRTKQTYSHGRQSSNSQQAEQKEFDLKLYEKFLNFMTRTRMQKLKQKLKYFYGRNFPIIYQEKYDFVEQWQGIERKPQKNLYDLIQSQNIVIQFTCMFIMLSNAFVIWSIGVERVFKGEEENSELLRSFMSVGILNRIASFCIKIYFQVQGKQQNLLSRNTVKILLRNIFTILYFILGLTGYYFNPIMWLLQIVICIHLYIQANKFYKFFRIIQVSLVYEYQFKIVDLMVNLLIIAHYLSILLYLGTLFDADKNWIKSMLIPPSGYLQKYLYSLYFGSTTILTIGYGDITPKNQAEIVIVIIVQFLGVVMFGYLINQIGHTLSAIRKNQENLQKDLNTLKRIENFYNIDSKIVNKAKGFLVSNQNAAAELTPDEENNLLTRLNEELRTAIISQKSLSIIKSSIFFLCRWSKEMQNNVAAKLQKALYAPNERLLQPLGKQRIYIIKRGKVQIYCDRFGHNRKEYRRLMKTIKINETNTIRENIYGYTAVISLRPSALDAVSSEFTSCYYIEKDQFLKCVNNCSVDFQYYHEIKCRIDQSQFCQAYQAPSILNIREHYNPSRTIIIRKNKARLSRLINNRDFFKRNDKRRLKKHHFKQLSKIIQDINDKLIYHSNDYIQDSMYNELSEDLTIQNKKEQDQTAKDTKTANKKVPTPARSSQIVNLNSLAAASKTDIFIPMVRKSLAHYFQRGQQYKNFFCTNNLSEVISRLENQNYNYDRRQQAYLSLRMYTNTTDFNFDFKLESK